MKVTRDSRTRTDLSVRSTHSGSVQFRGKRAMNEWPAAAQTLRYRSRLPAPVDEVAMPSKPVFIGRRNCSALHPSGDAPGLDARAG